MKHHQEKQVEESVSMLLVVAAIVVVGIGFGLMFGLSF